MEPYDPTLDAFDPVVAREKGARASCFGSP
jgi:hypothetical protein